MAIEPDPNHRWYIVHTLSGFEERVVEMLGQRAEALGLRGDLPEILVPAETIDQMGDARPTRGKRKFFPGYILVKMAMSEATYHLVKNTPKVTGFVGSRTPTPLADEEVQSILGQLRQDDRAPKPDVRFDNGETVRIIDGPFANFEGVIDRDDPERRVLNLTVKIFGRPTATELKYSQVQKI